MSRESDSGILIIIALVGLSFTLINTAHNFNFLSVSAPSAKTAILQPKRECVQTDYLCKIFQFTEALVTDYGGILTYACSRNDAQISCSMTQLQHWGCSQYGATHDENYCATGGFGTDLPDAIQSLLHETGTLTDSQRQDFYNSLQLSGDCRFGFYDGVIQGNGGDPSLPGTACVYSHYNIDGQLYSGIPCSAKTLDSCTVNMQQNSCYQVPANPATRGEALQIFYGSYSYPSGNNDLGTCSFTANLAQVYQTTTTTSQSSTTTTTTTNPHPGGGFDLMTLGIAGASVVLLTTGVFLMFGNNKRGKR